MRLRATVLSLRRLLSARLALGAALVGLASAWLRHGRRQWHRRLLLRAAADSAADTDNADDAAERALLLAEQLSRNTQFLGVTGQRRVSAARVAVVGVGGVGSHAAQLLARTGVGQLVLIDPARVGGASLRTHAVAAHADLGAPKVGVTRDALLRTVPDAAIEAVRSRLDARNAARLLRGATFVLLCMRDVETLAVAVDACDRAGVRCAAVLYPSPADAARKCVCHQRLSQLHDACGNLQARKLTAALRALLAETRPAAPRVAMVQQALLIVHSGEDPTPAADDGAAGVGRGAGDDDDDASRGATTYSSAGAVRAALGHAAAAACLAHLAGQPLTPSPGLVTRAYRESQRDALATRERDVFGCDAPLEVWPEDVEFLVNDVWGGRCALSGACIGGGVALWLTRWDREKPAAVDNLVLLTAEMARRHDRDSIGALGEPLVSAVQRTLQRAGEESRKWRRH